MITGLVTVTLIFSLPIIKVVTNHLERTKGLKLETIKSELELEKLKHANYLIETEKMRLELEKDLKLDNSPKIIEHKF